MPTKKNKAKDQSQTKSWPAIIKEIVFFAGPLILLTAGFLFGEFLLYQKINRQAFLPETNKIEGCPSRLTGVLTDCAGANLSPAAVMVENHLAARPVAGLAQARVVYEVLTEGEITRFLAIFDLAEDLAKIGPVRSARPYFIEIAKEYDALYAHCGGSPAALAILKSGDEVFDLNEFFGYNSGYFWRDKERTAPHNLYTATELLKTAKEQYELVDKQSDFLPWRFKDTDKNSAPIAPTIKIDFSFSPVYQATWQYNSTTGQYERWQNNSEHRTEDGELITADNVVVQFAPTRVLDEVGRREIKLTGQGRALVFRDGQAIQGIWQKLEDWQRTRFFDQNNQEIELNRGKIWIEIVPEGMEIKY